MNDKSRHVPSRSQRLTIAKMTPPDWFGWCGVAAMFLLMAVRLQTPSGVWFFPLLSLGEWLLLPLGVASLTMGFLSLSRVREKTLLPLWIAAIVPAVLWLAAMGLAILHSGVTPTSGDLFLSWAVHLVIPAMAFLPLFTMRVWRDRLMWALAGGLAVNAVAIFITGRVAGLGASDPAMLRLGGFLANQHDYGLMIAIALPLLAAWRGGENPGKNRSLAIMLCTFLLPALTLTACFTWMGLFASGVGLLVAWAAWRSHAWILGIFLALLIFGYGGQTNSEYDANKRELATASVTMGGPAYRRAFNTFMVRPFLGSGPDTFCIGDGHTPTETILCSPWYAALLGGSGLAGLGMWLVLLAELAARAMGRFGRRCLWHGGVLGSVAALGVAGLWTDGLPEGAGALVGVLLALSILEEPEEPGHAHFRRMRGGNAGAGQSARGEAPARKASGDTDVVPKR